jgi:adenylate cyclase
VLRALGEAGPEEALRPREAEVTVLFCDLRGFSRKAEASALLPVLERVSKALGVMTHNILDRKGVIADFLGDAALGFWGWPLEQPDKAEMASRAALGIRAAFEAFTTKPGHPLAEFRVGIGVATGPAVAGPIGTEAQAKVTVFGPIVNLASRLEGMTKLLRVPILLDEATRRRSASACPGGGRCRRLARVRPYGLATPLIVSELLPPADESLLGDEHLVAYERALDAFLAGEREAAYESLHRCRRRTTARTC